MIECISDMISLLVLMIFPVMFLLVLLLKIFKARRSKVLRSVNKYYREW